MVVVVDCAGCLTPLQLPPGAKTIRCAVCHAVTHVGPRPPLTRPHRDNQYLLPPPPRPPVHSRKKAVIVGICYRNSRNELKGCINDAKCMRYLLLKRFNFPSDSILLLSEEEGDPYRIPTKHNIRMAMQWLVGGCQAGDSLVFHYSGHGSQQLNHTAGDEVDGRDETLCPLDFVTQGMIVDDEINAAIVRPLPRGAKLHAVIDACHSGTVLDLPFLCKMDRGGMHVWEDHRPRSGAWKGTSGGEVICFSGCRDNQTSVDTDSLSGVTSTGVMTFSFIQAIERGSGPQEGTTTTYGSILKSMRSSIRSSSGHRPPGGRRLVTTLLSILVNGGATNRIIPQVPQLSANEPFDVYTKPFSI
ncbi:unnamed protein product [Cuscuta campestris]|uniref:Uncharacterized protein n=1 Tax=Cuscuta campestris TaxID=132261 RepID=A0A484LMC3_9ASTE|nr:unnamed protein product [Cuscuta campestris]